MGAYTQELGHRLHRLRVERGLTQRLAAAAGISTFTHRKLEKGEPNPSTAANPRLWTLACLAEVLSVEITELLPPRGPVGIAAGR
ncbi:helix-turn-helix domain-containing protein [Pimelobacter simplex]|uniref:helix-turn-helix domain-containing protein n=1 Tax=Nocardioides simplex TaxID=2045 RepID=UPI00380ACA40